MERKIRKFNDLNWFEWGALRNIKNNLGKECIYLNTLTRKTNVSFLGKVNYFGGGLIILIPKIDCNLNNINKYLEIISYILEDLKLVINKYQNLIFQMNIYN